jgi:hypothetical protein
VVDYFGHRREDVVEWLASVKWEEGLSVIEEKVVRDALGYVLCIKEDYADHALEYSRRLWWSRAEREDTRCLTL